MRFALISDVHFGPLAYHEGKLRKMTHQAGALTRRFVDRMNGIEQPELVINLGDVIEDKSRDDDLENYGRFIETMRDLEADVIHVAGNHDTINLTEDDLRGFWKSEDPLFYSRDYGGIHWVVLRTVEIKDTAIHLPEEQMVWLEKHLATAPSPTIVLMHHPASDMVLEGSRWFETQPHICRVAERKRLRGILEASGKVMAVFNGHVHWNHFDVISSIPYITLQSLTENVDDDAPGRPSSAWAVCDIDERRLVIHVHGAEPVRYQVERRI
ncbi:MAG: metallophosphoesterase [Polyangiaceae bacterium]